MGNLLHSTHKLKMKIRRAVLHYEAFDIDLNRWVKKFKSINPQKARNTGGLFDLGEAVVKELKSREVIDNG